MCVRKRNYSPELETLSLASWQTSSEANVQFRHHLSSWSCPLFYRIKYAETMMLFLMLDYFISNVKDTLFLPDTITWLYKNNKKWCNIIIVTVLCWSLLPAQITWLSGQNFIHFITVLAIDHSVKQGNTPREKILLENHFFKLAEVKSSETRLCFS